MFAKEAALGALEELPAQVPTPGLAATAGRAVTLAMEEMEGLAETKDITPDKPALQGPVAVAVAVAVAVVPSVLVRAVAVTVAL
jgi:hypothetical protein